MFPWGKDEEAAFGTGLEVLVAWFGEGVKAPRGEEDEGEAGIEGGAHDSLLSFGNGRGNKHGTFPCFCQEEGNLLLNLGIR